MQAQTQRRTAMNAVIPPIIISIASLDNAARNPSRDSSEFEVVEVWITPFVVDGCSETDASGDFVVVLDLCFPMNIEI